MPLIIKGGKDVNIVSGREMKNKIGAHNEEKNNDALSQLAPEVAERRREILAAKKHRDFIARAQRREEDAMRKLKERDMETTSELVVDVGPDPIIIQYDDVVKVSETKEETSDTPEFNSMTKKELDEWAEENLGLALDRRKKKSDLIEIIKKNL